MASASTFVNSTDEPWKEDIKKKLISVLKDDLESLIRVIFYLDEEDKAYKNDDGKIPPAWRTLKSAFDSDVVFKKYAERLAEDTRCAETDVGFRETMNRVYDQMMDASEEALPEEDAQGFDMVRITDMNLGQQAGFMGLARAWSLIPKSTQSQVLTMIPKLITNQQVISALDEVVSLVNKTGGNIVMIGLAAICLGYAAIKNLKLWWKGEISGKRCAKNIVDATFAIAAGVGGGVGGAAIGSCIGPWGTLVGGIIGGIISAQAANLLSDRLTQYIFGIPKDVALENAYIYLGVKMTASNNEINTAFRKLCLKHHPDKGGNKEDFIIVQINMGVVKMARGDMF